MCVTYQYSASMKRFFSILFILYCCNLFAMAPKLNWDKAIDKAIKRYGLRVEPQLISYFSKAGVSYPPKEIALLAFKSERKVELWAKNPSQEWTHIHDYPLTGFSGRLGPKLRENDKQIPEGIYKLVNFNPFSSMHLSMMINYPNSFDRQKGYMDGRKELGNNIFIHGKIYLSDVWLSVTLPLINYLSWQEESASKIFKLLLPLMTYDIKSHQHLHLPNPDGCPSFISK